MQKKLRFLGTKGDETYLRELHNDNARLAIKIRLNMVEWIQPNYGEKGECPLCGEEDSTEHIFSCDYVSRGSGVSVKDLENGQNMDQILQLFNKTEECRREKLLEKIDVNFDVLRREEEVESGNE